MGRRHSARSQWRCWCCGVLALVFLWAGAGRAQEAEQPYVLHVYTDLVQIPVLILNSDRETLARFRPQQLSLRLDEGKPFRPTLIRQEGADPISLVVLVDVRNGEYAFLQELKAAISSMASRSLNSRDHVEVVALDCMMARQDGTPGASPENLRRMVDSAIEADIHGTKHKPGGGCRESSLLGALARICAHLSSDRQSRHVVLALTDGHEGKRTISWQGLHEFAGETGTAIFAMDMQSLMQPWTPRKDEVDAFKMLTESTGGMAMTTSRRTMTADLEKFVKRLRERYIVEFPRPREATQGAHSITVHLDRQDAFIRTAGIGLPLMDTAVAEDPHTIHPDVRSDAPELGTRRPLSTRP